MIDLHFVRTPNGHKASIMLEELGVPYRSRVYDMLKGAHLAAAFRAINPNCRLPVIVDTEPDDGGAPLQVFDSGAILIYLARTSVVSGKSVLVRVDIGGSRLMKKTKYQK